MPSRDKSTAHTENVGPRSQNAFLFVLCRSMRRDLTHSNSVRETMSRDLKDTEAKLSTMMSNVDKDTDAVTVQLRGQVQQLEKDVNKLRKTCRKLKSDNSVSFNIISLGLFPPNTLRTSTFCAREEKHTCNDNENREIAFCGAVSAAEGLGFVLFFKYCWCIE